MYLNDVGIQLLEKYLFVQLHELTQELYSFNSQTRKMCINYSLIYN